MLKYIFALCLAITALSLTACSAQAQPENIPPILVDQFGYLPKLEKRAIIRSPEIGRDAGRKFSPSSNYAVIDVKTGRAVYQGAPMSWKSGRVDDASGDKVWVFDFSGVSTPGRYVIRDVDRRVNSYPFEIRSDIYTPVLKAAFKTFYLQRAGFEKRAPFAPTGFSDKASHLARGQDTQARLFLRKSDNSTTRDLRGGWYDAGDYNQYTSWTAEYITSLLNSYLENPNVWTDDFGIPESGNGVPDILDEVTWGLDWLERMQNPDGSMLSILGRDSASPPSSAKGASYYGPANSSATVASAGAFALAAKVYQTQGSSRSASLKYERRARQAWAWAKKYPRVVFKNNDAASNSEGLGAGQQEVEAQRYAKKRLIAASYLFAATGETDFANVVERAYGAVNPMSADSPNGFEGDMAFALLYFARQANVKAQFRNRILRDYGQNILGAYNALPAVVNQEDAYGAYTDGYWWGSNGVKARRGSVFTQAALANVGRQPKAAYLNAASHYLHYLHGVNPNGKVYLSNMEGLGAENSVNTFFHAWFKDGSRDYDDTRSSRYGPAPGFLVGGPNDGYEVDSCCARGTCGSRENNQLCRAPIAQSLINQPPAKSYVDFNEGWPVNSWAVTENSNSYQVAYIRLLSKFAR
ncbi:MAG: glycoside hydrolase family 9 protein [Litorimonas sp.]